MPAKNGRNVSLTAQQDIFIDKMLASGRYGSASEVVREALRLLEEEELAHLLDKYLLEGLSAEEQARMPASLLRAARDDIRAQRIQDGLDALERGEVVDGQEFFARWRKRLGAARGSAKKKFEYKRVDEPAICTLVSRFA